MIDQLIIFIILNEKKFAMLNYVMIYIFFCDGTDPINNFLWLEEQPELQRYQ